VALVSIAYDPTPDQIGLAGSRSQESCHNLRFRMSRLRRTACKTLAPSVYTHHGNTRPSSRPPHEWLRSCKIQEAGLFVKNPQLTARGTNLKFPIFASPKVRFSYDLPPYRLCFPSEPNLTHRPRRQKIPFLQNPIPLSDTGRASAILRHPPGPVLSTTTKLTARAFSSDLQPSAFLRHP
jgi:hypothetical protein